VCVADQCEDHVPKGLIVLLLLSTCSWSALSDIKLPSVQRRISQEVNILVHTKNF
jgi:hypothetical protein